MTLIVRIYHRPPRLRPYRFALGTVPAQCPDAFSHCRVCGAPEMLSISEYCDTLQKHPVAPIHWDCWFWNLWQNIKELL